MEYAKVTLFCWYRVGVSTPSRGSSRRTVQFHPAEGAAICYFSLALRVFYLMLMLRFAQLLRNSEPNDFSLMTFWKHKTPLTKKYKCCLLCVYKY